MATRIQLRRGTAAQWTSANPVLASGEPAVETDTGKRKMGDGVTAWADLPYDMTKAEADDLYATAEQGGKADSTYDLWPSGDQATDIENLTTVAATISANGGKVIRLAPGSYDFHHVTPDDIFDCYIVGDRVTVTPHSYVYPFSSVESIQSAGSRTNIGSRGRISIDLDDALLSHWTDVFPVTKELGVPMSSAWHTGNGAQWIKEAHRHGWEIMSHLPENITATTYLANGTLDDVAQESLDAVRAITGADRVGFVYPQHGRSLETDRVLSKYYSFGRGVAVERMIPNGMPSPWLTAGMVLDPELVSGEASERVKRILRTVADTNSSMVFYFHYTSVMGEQRLNALRDFVTTAQALGIEITTSSQIVGVQPLIQDPYLGDTTSWILGSNASWDTEHVYHGQRSMKFTPLPSSLSHSSLTQSGENRALIPTMPGHFTVVRLSIRRKHDNPITVSLLWGIGFTASELRRRRDGGVGSAGGGAPISARTPMPGSTVIEASPDWSRFAQLVYLAPDIVDVSFGLSLTNVSGGQDPVWFDEFKAEVVDYVTSVSVRGQLAGTANRTIYVPVGGVGRFTREIIPDTPPDGTITVTWDNTKATVKSTSASDTMGFTIRVTPNSSFDTDTPPDTGA